MRGDGTFFGVVVDHPAYRVIDPDRLEHADPPGVAALRTLCAALRRGDRSPRLNPENTRQPGLDLLLRPAHLAQPPDQPLRDHRAQGARQQERFDPHVAHPGDRARRVVGVDGGQHEVPGERGLDRDLGGFAVADFADHDHVGILAQNRAQPRSESQPDFRIDLGLADPVDRVFDRILDRQDIALAIVEPAQRGIQRGGLARSGRPGDQDDPVGIGERAAQQLFGRRIEPEVREIEPGVLLVEQAQHHPLARAAGQRRDAHVDQLAAERQSDPPVLRHAPFGDVEPGHDLDPADQHRRDVRRHPQLFLQHPVDPHPHHQRGLVRLDVDIRDALAQPFGDQAVDQADRGGIVGAVEQVFGGRQAQRQRIERVADPHVARHRRRAAIERVAFAEEFFELRGIDAFQRERPAKASAQLEQVERIGPLAHRQPHRVGAVVEHEIPVISRGGIRDGGCDGGCGGFDHAYAFDQRNIVGQRNIRFDRLAAAADGDHRMGLPLRACFDRLSMSGPCIGSKSNHPLVLSLSKDPHRPGLIHSAEPQPGLAHPAWGEPARGLSARRPAARPRPAGWCRGSRSPAGRSRVPPWDRTGAGPRG